MTEHKELLIYRAIFSSPLHAKMIERAMKIVNLGMKVDLNHFRQGRDIRNAFRTKKKLMKIKDELE